MGTTLILSFDDDPTAASVAAALSDLDADYAWVDPGDFPRDIGMAASIDPGGSWTGQFGPIRFEDIDAVYYRRPTTFRFSEGLSDADRAAATAEARIGVGGVLAALPVRWVNHPHSIAAAEYKPCQLAVASAVGLVVPATYIGNDAQAARVFAKGQTEGVVCKEMGHSFQLITGDADPSIVWTTRIDPAMLAADSFAVTAHMVQAWVPKRRDIRVTVVGSETFAVAVDTDSSAGHVDWRSDYAALTYVRTNVPSDVASAIQRFMATMGLAYGALDFTLTPGGTWVFLEVNPSGEWLWLEEETGAPIAAALAALLVGDTMAETEIHR